MILPFLRPIEPFILDPEVSEIMVNGPEHVFIERRGFLEEAPSRSTPSPSWWRSRTWRGASAAISPTRNRSSTHACPTARAWRPSSRRAASRA